MAPELELKEPTAMGLLKDRLNVNTTQMRISLSVQEVEKSELGKEESNGDKRNNENQNGDTKQGVPILYMYREMPRRGCYNCYDTNHQEKRCDNPCRICKELYGKIDKSHTRWRCRHKKEYTEKIKAAKDDKYNQGDKALLAEVKQQQKENSAVTAQLAKAVQKLTSLLNLEGNDEKSD
jgi:hypothetical protein